MCSGNGSLQTDGFPVRGNQTPPAPLFAASQAPMWTGSPGINSSRCVGRVAACRRSPKALRADRIGPVIRMRACWAACWAAWSRENWPSLPGIPGVQGYEVGRRGSASFSVPLAFGGGGVGQRADFWTKRRSPTPIPVLSLGRTRPVFATCFQIAAPSAIGCRVRRWGGIFYQWQTSKLGVDFVVGCSGGLGRRR
jgi:hypothetical protein